ncbi:MAG: amidohydrolase family protein [Saprospiraceae bacterium]|nr:amidohydrolase family protein [Saprospiraceae bacterium]
MSRLQWKGYLWLGLLTLAFSKCVQPTADTTTTPARMDTLPLPEKLLLDKYRPTTIYNIPHTEIAQARYPVIDLHSHPYAKTADEVDAWVKTMDEVGLDKAVIMTYQTGPAFDSLVQLYNTYPNRFILFCGFDYSGYDKLSFGPAAVAELERCVAMGAKGVGELGDKGKGLFYSKPTPAWGMHIDDPRMDPLIQRCGELNIPISIHVAEPLWMYEPMDSTNDGLMNAYTWRLDDQRDILDHAEMIETLERAVQKHPETRFIACHYANCSYDLTILGRLFDRYPNLYADIGARYAETATIPRYAHAFFNQYDDRLLYGTDMGNSPAMYRLTFRILETDDEHFYYHDYFTYHWPLNGYNLSDEVLKKVYRDNALKLFGPQ